MASEESLATAVGALLQAQGIAVSAERAGRLATALGPLLQASARDDAEQVPDFGAVAERERWRA